MCRKRWAHEERGGVWGGRRCWDEDSTDATQRVPTSSACCDSVGGGTESHAQEEMGAQGKGEELGRQTVLGRRFYGRDTARPYQLCVLRSRGWRE